MKALTPMMQQYMSLKSQFKDSILFFRLGDFYEMFFEDALTASRELEITLTQRDCGLEEKAPMCGVPHHVAENYISRLVAKGFKVAVADQVEDPSVAKGIVKRDVVRVVTPGTITDTSVLNDKENNYLTSIFYDKYGIGISYVDNSTGEMYTTEFKGNNADENYNLIIDELGKILPKEIICNEEFLENHKYINIIKNKINPIFNVFDTTNSRNLSDVIERHFENKTLAQLNLESNIYAMFSTGKLLEYLYETQKNSLEHITGLIYFDPSKYMIMDINTRANLELLETIISKQKKGSLIYEIDRTVTSMGARLLKRWLEQPLQNIEEINRRLNMVEYLLNNIIEMDELVNLLKNVYDIERLASKLSNGSINGRDLIALKNSIFLIPKIKMILKKSSERELLNIENKLDSLDDIYNLINLSIEDDAPITIKEGNLIKNGYSKELDTIREASSNGKEWLSQLEYKEREKTGIKNLKIGYNRISGYYFEVTKSNLSMVPEYFIRKQTLANSERYYTIELKDMESQILGSLEKSLQLEYEIFINIRDTLKEEILRLQKVSRLIAEIDVLISFANSAYENDYIRPQFNDDDAIEIIDGRHPVVESFVKNNLYVPNDTYLDLESNMIQIITGPNMAGKSTYMRQVAIIVLLAHVGAFVPAKEAKICIVDRIFTRIGASDNLSQGESTFMVEMNEVANIVRDASQSSLIILDEVGRGTSTYDGLSIAWAIVEYIAKSIKAKTLFATHYHELTQLENSFDSISNLTISVEEKGNDVIFLRKVIKGSTNKSYGIQVAKLAGLNDSIINRSNEILKLIEKSHEINIQEKSKSKKKQLDLIDHRKDYFINQIQEIDVNNMTPMEALKTLDYLVKDAESIKEF